MERKTSDQNCCCVPKPYNNDNDDDDDLYCTICRASEVLLLCTIQIRIAHNWKTTRCKIASYVFLEQDILHLRMCWKYLFISSK